MVAQRNRRPVRSPENYCPICGVYTPKEELKHRCSSNVLRAIDAANTRALRYEAEYNPFTEPNADEKLKFGFELMFGAEE